MKEWTREEKYRYLKDPQELKGLYDQISKSAYRQTFHNQAVTGLMNDPNGFVWHDNKWHLFYQWCPWGAVHGLKHWYHIISKDLVTWRNLGVCLLPDQEDGYDNRGVYSGSAMPIGDKIYLYYTGNHRNENWVRHAYTCLARLGNDGWPEKYPLPLFGANPDYTEHQRDPKIICMPGMDIYYMLIGAQTKDHHGCCLVYSSHDLQHGWQFAGELKVPGYENFGDMWECPSIEYIGGKDVLLFCPQHMTLPGRGQSQNHNGYFIGHMDWYSLTFTPEGQFHVLDFGFDSYAAACANNLQEADKAVLIAWMGVPDVSYPTDEENWAGCLTLPRELTVRNRRLVQQPLPELKKLRDERISLTWNEFGCYELPRAAEVEIDCRKGDVNLKFFTNEKGEGGLSIVYDDATGYITVDRSGMTITFNEQEGSSRQRHLDQYLNHLRIFIDSSSIEIFVNDGAAVFTSRVFPTPEEHYMVIEGDVFERLWTLKPAVKDEFLI
ncbi:MAG: sucrose-6-phosphate hydrolase [Erysipelotrichaceae bacterium]|nr:sucrose-6-phosphate hydrolase [Erysipelotrichaceae bacterium]